MRSVVVSLWSYAFGHNGGDDETAIFKILKSNPSGKNAEEQCLVGSFNGALSSKRVTEESIKVSYGRMEIDLVV